jgi:serine protease Do
VAATAPGTKVPVEVVRKGQHETKTIEIEELAPSETATEAPGTQDDRGSTAFGFDISDVPVQLREHLGLAQHEGALITRVYPGGSAGDRGVREGDLILEVDRSHVTGGLDAEAKLRKAGDQTLLLLRRDDAEFFAVLARQKK